VTRLASWQLVALSVATVGVGALIIARAGTAQESTPALLDAAVIPWGDPVLVDGDAIAAIGPAWCLGASKEGGAWNSNLAGTPIPGWVVEETDTNPSCLLIRLDRSLMTNDLRMDVTMSASTGAVVGVELIDAQGNAVDPNPVLGDLVGSQGVAIISSVVLPLRDRPAASVVKIRRECGSVVVYNTMLSPIGSAGPDATGQLAVGVPNGLNIDVGGDQELSTNAVATLVGADGDQTHLPSGDGAAPVESGRTNGAPSETPAASVIYVDAENGNDANTGRRDVASVRVISVEAGGSGAVEVVDGPKATIGAGLAIATGRDRVVIRSGNYAEQLNVAGHDVKVRIDGVVNLKRRPAAVIPLSESRSGTNSLGQTDDAIGVQTNAVAIREAMR
jgi:hypothetical protein